MTVFGKGYSKVAYYDLESILTFSEVKLKTQKRFNELMQQGFTKDQTMKIIFDCSDFKDSFLDPDKFDILRNKF